MTLRMVTWFLGSLLELFLLSEALFLIPQDDFPKENLKVKQTSLFEHMVYIYPNPCTICGNPSHRFDKCDASHKTDSNNLSTSSNLDLANVFTFSSVQQQVLMTDDGEITEDKSSSEKKSTSKIRKWQKLEEKGIANETGAEEDIHIKLSQLSPQSEFKDFLSSDDHESDLFLSDAPLK
ncbi:hypothetical protein RhiirA4_467317 [Rhizophagus irregularis]|uniref:Uncharacterized protein n=1 Tax=Rhizophagus irregularis TaxID=588596 RepID=A0A2I1GVN9_9GLOM|nr:hypothetical protein RhiirA4_467317 [Rhizophagus irregularis]